MASAGGFSTQTSGSDDWLSCANSAIAVVKSSLTEAPFSAAIDAIDQYRNDLSALEALLIAQRKQAGHSDRATEGIIKRGGGVSKGGAKKRTKRADAVGKNPTLAKKMTKGELSTEQVDLVADASSKTDGEAASDPKLIDDISNANPDQGKAIARKYIEDHQSSSDRDSRYRWQRDRRKAYRKRSLNGMSQLILEGDDESIESMLRTIRKRSDANYRRDGGRDVAMGDHERTHDQRMFDAAAGQILGEPVGSSGAPSGPEPGGNRPTPPANRPGERPTMVFSAKLSDITDDPDALATWEAELVGTGIVPTAVASYFRCISDHAAQLLSESGEPRWFGRARRHVTSAQWLALVARDEGCVLCDAHHTMCEAHHLVPWHAPAKGETNVDQMALVCVDCHHRIHDNNLTLYRDAERRWRLRNATPDEVAPTGRHRSTGRRSQPDRRATRRTFTSSATSR